MEHDLTRTTSLLERTPAALDALLRGLPDAWTRRDEGPGTWSAREVVAHLAHADRTNWLPRARVILAEGESGAFAPFDREGQRRADRGEAMGGVLDDFARVRTRSLGELRALGLGPEDLARRGRHPAFGPVTLGELLATWAAHDLTHLHQISRVLADAFREAVGPWSAYLGVLRCGAEDPAPAPPTPKAS